MRLLALLLLACPLACGQPDWFVDASATNPFATGSKSDPFQSITQAMLAAIGPNQRIFVAPGTYSPSLTAENFPIQFGSNSSGGPGVDQTNLLLLATGGPSVTTIDGEGGGTASGLVRMYASAAGCKMSGFTIQGYGGTLATIRLGSTSSSFIAMDNEVANCVIDGMGPGLAGIATFGSSPGLKIHDNIFINCGLGSVDLGAIWASDINGGGGGDIYNNTFVGNRSGIRLQGGTWNVFNNIVANNTVEGIWVFTNPPSPAPGVYNVDYNCSFGNAVNYLVVAPGPNAVAADPLFVNAAGGDYHLGPGSPCEDAGSPTLPGYMRQDVDGDPRQVTGSSGMLRPDIGADEVTDVAMALVGPASIGFGTVGIQTTGPAGSVHLRAVSLFTDANTVIPGAGNLMLDLATLFFLDPLAGTPIPPGGVSLLGVPLAGLPPSAIGTALSVQAAVIDAGGPRFTNEVLAVICP